MGDFNAGCDFVKDWSQVSLATDRRFYWVIGHSVDTTTGRTDCPYDRIVVSGKKLLKNILPYSAGIFNFDEEYGLTSSQVLLLDIFCLFVAHIQIINFPRYCSFSSETSFSVTFYYGNTSP